MISAPMLALADAALVPSNLVSAKNITEDCKDCNPKENKERNLQKREEHKNTITNANSIVPGIEAQWLAVKNERRELITQLIEKNKNSNVNKGSSENQKEDFRKLWNESMKTAWDNFSKAVDSKNKEEIQTTFSKLLSLNQEINENLKVKLKSN